MGINQPHEFPAISSRQSNIAKSVLVAATVGISLFIWDGCSMEAAARHVIEKREGQGAISYCWEILERNDTVGERIFNQGEIRAAQSYLRDQGINYCFSCQP